MPLFGVRYRNPFDGPLIKVDGPIGAAAALSRHADCLTWVVTVEYDKTDRLVQVGNPLHEHDGRIGECVPEVAFRPAPPSPHQLERRAEYAAAGPVPTDETMSALSRLHRFGERPADARTRAALHRRGWSDVDARFITPQGLVAAQRHRERQGAALAGVSS